MVVGPRVDYLVAQSSVNTPGENATGPASTTTGENATGPASTTTGENATGPASTTTGENATGPASTTTGENATGPASTTTGENTTGPASTTTGEDGTELIDKSLPLEAVPVTENIAQNGTVTIDLPLENRQPPGANWTYVLDSLPLYGSIPPFMEKGDQIPNGIIPYKSAVNFIGEDYFRYKIYNDTSSTNPSSISITTSANFPLIEHHILRTIVAILVAAGSITTIALVASRIITSLRNKAEGNPISASKFWDIIRSNNMDPSLSVFQFFLWTIVLMFALFSIYLIRIFGGVTEPISGTPPYLLLALTGISFATPFASSIISSIRYPKADTPNVGSTSNGSTSNGNTSNVTPSQERPPWGEMLREFGKPSLSRFQMFGWTWISIAIYLFLYAAEVTKYSTDVVSLTIPDVFPILVALMGLSEVVFLGAKAAVTSQIEITKVFPLQVRQGGNLSIFGLNFGNDRQDVWLGNYRIRSDDREHLLGWSNGRIDIKIPVIPEDAKSDGYELMVVKGGSSKIAYKGSLPIKIKIL